MEKALKGFPMMHFRQYKPIDLRKAIHGLILILGEQFNVSRPMSQNQVSFIVETFIRDYSMENIDDIALFCQRAATGRYGKAYGGLDQPTILEWFSKYLDEKYEEKETQIHKQQRQQAIEQEEAFTSALSPETLAMRKEFMQQLGKPRERTTKPVVNASMYYPKKTEEDLNTEEKVRQQDEHILAQLKELDFSELERNDIKVYYQEMIMLQASESAKFLKNMLEKCEDE